MACEVFIQWSIWPHSKAKQKPAQLRLGCIMLPPWSLCPSHVFAPSTHWIVKEKELMAHTFGLSLLWKHSSCTFTQMWTWRNVWGIKSRAANSLAPPGQLWRGHACYISRFSGRIGFETLTVQQAHTKVVVSQGTVSSHSPPADVCSTFCSTNLSVCFLFCRGPLASYSRLTGLGFNFTFV